MKKLGVVISIIIIVLGVERFSRCVFNLFMDLPEIMTNIKELVFKR